MTSSTMARKGRLLLTCLLLCLFCGGSLASNGKEAASDRVYDSDGYHWTILMQPEKKSCSLVIGFEEDAMVYIGEDDWTDDVLFYFIFVKKGLSFSRSKNYDVGIEFGRDYRWRKEASGARVGDYGGVYVRGLDGKFGVNFAQAGAMVMKIDGKDYGAYDLTGAREGMLRLLKCEDDMDQGKVPSRRMN